MQCLECGATPTRLDNDHLLACCGLTLHEYALRHHTPLELLLAPEQVGGADDPHDYPPPQRADEAARATLAGLELAGLLRRRDGWVEVPGEVRRLDLLLWDLAQLSALGFRFRQEYRYEGASHRVVAANLLRAPAGHLPGSGSVPQPPPSPLDVLAVCVAHVAELHAGYLFLPLPERRAGEHLCADLYRHHRLRFVPLESVGGDGCLLRALRPEDGEGLLNLLAGRLEAMPGALARFRAAAPAATVSKEVVFDAAHFITDHPAKCSNLHGGRYVLHVKVHGRIDPVTGCVVDYGYLKRVVNRRVIEGFDHHHLNYAAPELAWRSSTEMLCVYIWERLIDYLPGLAELQLYETPQSYCSYRGPDLPAFQRDGSAPLLGHFGEPALGRSPLRAQLTGAGGRRLKVVAQA